MQFVIDREGSEQQLSDEDQSINETPKLYHYGRDATNESDLRLQWFDAAHRGIVPIIRRLIDKHVNIALEDDMKNTALHICASYGHKEAVRLLLNEDAAVNAKNRDYNSALHYAAGKGHIEVVRQLIDKGAAVNAKNKNRDTALHRAAENGNKKVVRLLLDYQAVVDVKNQNCRTALHLAAHEGHKEVVSILLQHDIYIRAENQGLHIALHLAACSGHKEVVRLMLQHGTIAHSTTEGIRTTLLEVIKEGHLEVVELLLDELTVLDENNQQSKTVLRKAVMFGDEEVVVALLTICADVDEKSADGKPLLAELSEIGYIRMAAILLKHGADIEARDLNGQTPLMIAAKAAQLDIVSLLLDRNANIEAAGNDSLTTLLWSAQEGHLSIAETLLQNGAKIEAKTNHGDTALHLAAESNHVEIVAVLIDKDADLNVVNDDNRTPIKLAISKGHVDIVYKLKEAGAIIGSFDDSNLSLLYLAAEAGQDSLVHRGLEMVINEKERNRYRNATLCRAAQYGQINVVSSLLENGAGSEACDENGLSPLFLAGQYPEILSMLIHHGASIKAENVQKQNQSILHHFASHHQIDALLISLNCGCNINATDVNDNTALHYAAKNNDIEVADVLLRRGIDINFMNCRGETALHIAVENGHFSLAKWLIESGIDIEAKTFISQLTALHIALEAKKTEIISLLVGSNADVNTRQSKGQTALHIAAESNLIEACRLVIKHGAKVNSIANGQMTPLRLAIANFNRDLVNLLLSHHASVHRIGHVGNPIKYAISIVEGQIGYTYYPGFIPVIKSLIEAGAETTGIQISEDLKQRYPTLEDIFANTSTPLHNTAASQSSEITSYDMVYSDTKDIVLNEYRASLHDDEGIGNGKETRLLNHAKHKYGYGFPLSKRLRLEDLPNLLDKDKRDEHTVSKTRIQPAQSIKLFDTISLDNRAIALIRSLLDRFSVQLFISDQFFMLEVDGDIDEMPPKWASDFDKVEGIIRQPGLLIVQVPSRKATLSVTAWHEYDHPYLRFIDAIYTCRRLSKRLDQEAFSDVLGGSEQALATNLHSVLIAGLSILSIVGGDGLVDKLVWAILGRSSPTNHSYVEWQTLNQRKCPCGHRDFHRPLSPVAAAKAVGVDIWRERQKQLVNRVWDLLKDELVDTIDGKQKFDAREVVFITHKWKDGETTHQDVMKRKSSNNQSISLMSEKLRRIRHVLQKKDVRYVWLDTICNDSSNLSELDEAIRSMYKWYANCAVVVLDSDTKLDDWCARGWCLQEGAAAGVLCGITKDGENLATIQELAIEQRHDLCTLDLHLYYRLGNAAEILVRMDVRETTRDEDMSYALAGLFSIHLTLGYGEGFKSRERLFHELATKKGDLSFLSFPSDQEQFRNYLPIIGQPNYLVAKCREASAPVMVSHFGICFDVQLVDVSNATCLLQTINAWKDLSFANGRSLGVEELIQMTEIPEVQNSSSMKIAIVHYIRSIILVESYGEDFQTGGDGRPIICCHRLQCCQIEENEFSRLFKEDREKLRRIWLRDMPDGAGANMTAIRQSLLYGNKKQKTQ